MAVRGNGVRQPRLLLQHRSKIVVTGRVIRPQFDLLAKQPFGAAEIALLSRNDGKVADRRRRWWDRSSGPKHKAAWHLRSRPCVAPPGLLPTAVAVSNVPQRRSFSSGKRSTHIALPIVSVLDIETRRAIKLHIDDGTGELHFVDRARSLEQGSVILMAGCSRSRPDPSAA